MLFQKPRDYQYTAQQGNGETVEEAIANAEVITREWIETAKERGQDIPEPKGRLMYA